MSEPPQNLDPTAASQDAPDQRKGAFVSGGVNHGTVIGVQINHGTQVNLHALLHDHTGFMQDRLASFVGRADELAEVQRRIADLLPTGGYVTITGQAGQGKSSLIAKLVALALRECVGEDLSIAQLVERAGPVALAYHFIPFQPGPDHQVGLLRNLMARLIGKYGLSDLYVATDSRPALRDYFARVLIEVAARGGQEVIYLDGLDQIEEDATGVRDLSFLPTNPPAGIVFVLGTRPNDTLRPLELRKPHATYWLPPLSRADFGLILQHRGVTLEAHLADRFYTVMEANALYLDLVARELAQAGALPAEQIIAQVADNPENLFSLAVERLKRPPLAWREVIKPVLGLLLAAREPLRLRAIRTLIGQPDDAVQEGLERLGGLLQRDGEGRYTLFHLKLRDYLREDTVQSGKRYVFAADEEGQWHARLVVWADESGGQAVIWQDKVGDALEQDRRAYARQHYITHLCLAKNWPRLWEVLDAGEYTAAKLRHDPSTRSVVLDLDLVRQQMVAAMRGDYEKGVAWLPRLWRYSLLRGSLASQADNYPDGLIPLLANLGQVQEAIGLAEVLTNEADKARVLAEIGSVLKKKNQITEAMQMWLRATEVAYSTKNDHRRNEALVSVCEVYAQNKSIDTALMLARLVDNDKEYSRALLGIAQVLAQNGDVEKNMVCNVVINAIKVISLMKDTPEYVYALLLAIDILDRIKKIDAIVEYVIDANEIINSTKSELVRSKLIKVITKVKFQISDIKSVCSVSEELMKVVNLIGDADKRVQVLVKIAEAHNQIGNINLARSNIEEAIKASYLINNINDHAEALVAIVEVQKRIGEIDSARKTVSKMAHIAHSIDDANERAQLLVKMAKAQNQIGEIDTAWSSISEAEQLVHSIEDTRQHDRVLGEMIEVLLQSKQVKMAFDLSCLIDDSDDRASALENVAEVQFQIGEIDAARASVAEAVRIVRLIKDSEHAFLLEVVAKAQARAGEIERSLALVHLIEDVDECVRVLGEVVEVLAQTKKVEVAQVYDVVVKAEEAAYSIKGGWICANVLNLTTKAKIKLGYTELARLSLEEAIKAANSIEDTVDRSIALAELTGLQFQLGEANMGRLTAGESIQSAQSIEDNEYRTYALRMITETLAHFGKVEEVLILKNLLEETEGRSWGLRMASEAYARAGVIDTALDFARLIEGADERSWVLMDIFESLLHIGETDMGKEIINESIEAARAIEDTFSRASTLWYVVEKLTSSGLAVEVGCLATESLSYLESLSSFERLFLLEQVGSTLGKTPHHSITFSLLHDHWSNLIRRDEFIVLLPAVASLLVAKPPLLQELLDGFEWVDQVLKKW